AFQCYANTDKQGNVSIRRIDDDAEIVRLPGPGGPVEPYWGFDFSPDGRFLHHRCHTQHGDTSRLWKLDGDKPVIEGYQLVAFRNDCRQAAVSYDNGDVRILDLASGNEVAHWSSGMPGCLLRWNPMKPEIALRGGPLLKIVDVATGNTLLEKRMSNSRSSAAISWHPEGRMIACTGDDRKILLLDSKTGELVLPPLDGHKNSGIVLNFNSNGDRLISNDWS